MVELILNAINNCLKNKADLRGIRATLNHVELTPDQKKKYIQ